MPPATWSGAFFVGLGRGGNTWRRFAIHTMTANRPPGLIQRYREELEVRHYARRTMKNYEQWLRRFLRFHTSHATQGKWGALM